MKTFITILLLLFCISTKSQTGLGDFKIDKTKVDFVISKYPDFKEITDSNSQTRKFICEKYRMLNIDVKNIELIFYNDYLINFKCDRDPLIERYLYSKYGRPKVKQTNHVVEIYYITYDEEIHIFEWKHNNIVTISSYTKQWHDHFDVIVNSNFNIYKK